MIRLILAFRSLLVLSLWTWTCAVPVVGAGSGDADQSRQSRPARPNVLLLFADDLGYEALGGYGGLDFSTPHLDRLAQQGIRFTRAYITAAFGNDHCVFDGQWRLHSKDGILYDCRQLPAETRVANDTPESAAARKRLRNLMIRITR